MYEKILTIGAITMATCISFSELHAREILPEVRAAYFHPKDHRFRSIYSAAGLFCFETNVQAWKGLYPWASLCFLHTSGSSLGEGNRTQLYMIPIGIGLKYFFKFDRIQPYLGAGMIIAYTHIHNDYSFVIRNQSDWGVGGIAKTGFLVYIIKSLFFDFFFDYTFLKMRFNHSNKHVITRKADLSGFSIGGGIGYRF